MPMVVGAAVLAAAGITASATVASVVGSVIIAGASLGLQLLLRREEQASPLPTPQNGRQSTRQGISPRVAGFGRCRIGGTYMLYEERDGHSYDNLAHCEGPIVGIISYFLHNDHVGLDVDGFVDELLDSTVGAKTDGRYGHQSADTVRIKSVLGTYPQAAENVLFENLPDIWTADHRGDGIANSTLICKAVTPERFDNTYPHGLPQLSIVADLLPCWDPRNPLHDRLDPSTWTISYNPIIQLIRYLTDERLGQGIPYEEVIEPVLTRYIQAATQADEQGYTSNGFYRLDTDPSEIVSMILATCDGMLLEDGEGHLVPWIGGMVPAPTFEILEEHIKGFSIRIGNEDEGDVDQLDFSYTSPEHDYNEVDGDPWVDQESIDRRAGVPRVKRIPLTWIQTHDQARKVAKFAFNRLRAYARGTVVLGLYGLGALGERWLTIQYPFFSFLANATIEVANIEVDIFNDTVTIDWVLVDNQEISEFDPETEGGEEPPVVEAPADSELLDNNLEFIADNNGNTILV